MLWKSTCFVRRRRKRSGDGGTERIPAAPSGVRENKLPCLIVHQKKAIFSKPGPEPKILKDMKERKFDFDELKLEESVCFSYFWIYLVTVFPPRLPDFEQCDRRISARI